MAVDPKKLEALLAVISEWQPKLMLGQWQVKATFVERRNDCRANIQIDHWRLQAMIRINEDEEESAWPGIVVHELLHLVVHPWSLTTLKFIERLPAGERELAEVWRFQSEETVIERLTQILAGRDPFYPAMLTSWRQVE